MTIALGAVLVAAGFLAGGITIGCLALYFQRERKARIRRYQEIL